MIRLLIAAGLLIAFDASAQSLPRAEPVPGGIAVIPLETAADTAPHAYLGGERVMVVRHAHNWFAVVGLALSAHPGERKLRVTDGAGHRRTYRFAVHSKKYGVERIRLKNKQMVNPTPAELKRILGNLKDIHHAFAEWRNVAAPPLSLDLPVHGRVSGAFGVRRFFNGQARHPHSGLDLAVPRGTPILAPAAGVVIETGDYYFNGKTVFIDHGQGLVTMYNHMDRIAVRPGEKVARGQRIGEVGATGRVTGPHLHWGVSLNDARVNPLLFVPEKSTAHSPQPQ